MARIVRIEDHTPLLIDPKAHAAPLAICRCGLSQDWPYCDGSHKQTRDEEDGTTYAYHREGGALRRAVVTDPPRADPRS